MDGNLWKILWSVGAQFVKMGPMLFAMFVRGSLTVSMLGFNTVAKIILCHL